MNVEQAFVIRQPTLDLLHKGIQLFHAICVYKTPFRLLRQTFSRGAHLLNKVLLDLLSLLFALHDSLHDGEGEDLVLNGNENDPDQEVHPLRIAEVFVQFCIGSEQVVYGVFASLQG